MTSIAPGSTSATYSILARARPRFLSRSHVPRDALEAGPALPAAVRPVLRHRDREVILRLCEPAAGEPVLAAQRSEELDHRKHGGTNSIEQGQQVDTPGPSVDLAAAPTRAPLRATMEAPPDGAELSFALARWGAASLTSWLGPRPPLQVRSQLAAPRVTRGRAAVGRLAGSWVSRIAGVLVGVVLIRATNALVPPVPRRGVRRAPRPHRRRQPRRGCCRPPCPRGQRYFRSSCSRPRAPGRPGRPRALRPPCGRRNSPRSSSPPAQVAARRRPASPPRWPPAVSKIRGLRCLMPGMLTPGAADARPVAHPTKGSDLPAAAKNPSASM